MAQKQRPRAEPTDVEIDWEGKPYRGWYSVEGDVVIVNSLDGTKRALLQGSAPPRLARMLLTELAAEARPPK